MTTPGRRSLRFATFDEVRDDVSRLLAGHRTVGNWSLSEICQHLTASMRLALSLPATTTPDPSLRLPDEDVRRIFETDTLPEGLNRPSQTEPFATMDEAQAADILSQAIAQYQRSSGPVGTHRFLGSLSKEQWDHLQRIHCAHHLSFAVPTSA